MEPEISVIIPIYNSEKYIRETLDSLIFQSDNRFTVIIVNDGSTDKSEQIVKEYIENSCLNIKYIKQKNSGVSKARNKGIDQVETPYIMFLDSDDKYHNKMIESILLLINNFNTDLVGNGHVKDYKTFQTGTAINSEIVDLITLKKDILFNNRKHNFCDFCYQTKIIRDNNIYFDLNLKYGEDELFLWQYLTHSQSAYKTDKPYYYYRDNESSATKNISYDRAQVVESQVRAYEYLQEHQDDFAPMIKRYGIPRAKLAILREFAISRKFEIYKLLQKSEKYRTHIYNLILFPDVKIKIAALLYFLSPKLFYKFVK